MHTTQQNLAFLFVLGLGFLASPGFAREAEQSEREAMYYRYLEFPSYVQGGSIEPHWMADGNSFWYGEGAPDNTVIWKVDPKKNTKVPLFDTTRLRQALTPLLGHELPYQGLPFDKFTFVDGEKAVKFSVEGKEFILRLDTYTITRLPALEEEEKVRLVPQIILKDPAGHPVLMELFSPNRRWLAGVREYNLWLRSTYDGRSVQITTDGVKDYEWDIQRQGARWSPDSFKLAVKKLNYRKVPKIPVVHWLQPTAEVDWVRPESSFTTTEAGAPLPVIELFVVDILSKRQVRIDTGKELDQHLHIVGWWRDGSELLFLRANRELKTVELMAADPVNGSTRVVLTETQKTFVSGIGLFYAVESMFSQLEDEKKFIWMSERSGWYHLYLYDRDGNLIRQLTKGDFPVVSIEAVDEKAGWVYFTAHGERKRPYDTHLYRVSLEGKEFTRLTEGTGRHDIQVSPSNAFFLDTHSSIDRPPAVELRRADGALLQTLSKASVDALKELQWIPPEEFVVKAADGKTALYGALYKPYDFDPNKKYPVIEVIYAGPHVAVVQRSFVPQEPAANALTLAQLGFITFMVDGRGTPERGKEFQDLVYGNIGRHEIPDHVATLKQLAEKHPYMDLGRVGITGHSFGGYLTIRSMLLAPDVYHVGVASAPVVDPYYGNAMEVYLGLPQNNKEGYEYASNLRLARNLKGRLLLIVGTLDAIPFSSTMKMSEAFIRAGKPYDLLVLPEQDHFPSGASGRYWDDVTRWYFQEHLKP